MTQWRQTDDGMWQYRADDGYWYPGDGPSSTPPDVFPPVVEDSAVPPSRSWYPSLLNSGKPQHLRRCSNWDICGQPSVGSGSRMAGTKKWWIIGGVAVVVLAGAGIGIAARRVVVVKLRGRYRHSRPTQPPLRSRPRPPLRSRPRRLQRFPFQQTPTCPSEQQH